MPASFLSPGVYVREISNGARSIQGVGTSVAGFIGLSDKGPIGKPRLITSMEQYVSSYGSFTSYSYLTDAVDGFFRNGGTAAWIVRTANYSDPTTGTLDSSDNIKATATLKDRSAGAGTNTLKIDALNEGEWGNDVSVTIRKAGAELGSFNRVLGSDGGVISSNTAASKTPGLYKAFTEVSSVFSDVTSVLSTVGGGAPFAIPSAVGDSLYLGTKELTFDKLYFDLDVAGVAGEVSLQYWNGSSWQTITPSSDATNDFKAAAADNLLIQFTAPSDWKAVEVNGNVGFFARFLVTTLYSTPAQISRLTIGEDRPFGVFTTVASATLEVAAATAIGDAFYIGSNQGFNFVELDLATAGDVTGVVAWEYWNGTVWSAVSGITETAVGAQHLRASGIVGFDLPSNWKKTTVNAEEFFWVRGRITTNFASAYPSANHIIPQSNFFRMQVFDSGNLVEDYENLTMDTASANYVEKRIGTVASPRSSFITVDDQSSLAAIPNNRPRIQENTKLAGGVYTVSSINDGDYIGSAAGQTGLYAFDQIDEVNILAIPGITTEAVHLAMLNYCELRLDLFCIIDSPANSSSFLPQDLIEYVRDTAALNSSYGAIYDYWIEVSDLITGARKTIPPSGHIAGIYARTDFNRGVWKSPAGIEDGRIFGALGVVYNTSPGERDLLYPARINPIRDVGGVGVHVDGGKTLATPGSDFDRIAIRRLFLFVEESIQEGIQFVKHEPNNATTRRRVTATINSFLVALWQDGGLNGEQPADAFFVICNDSNNSPIIQRQFRLVARIGLAPVFPAEFIDLTFELDQRALNEELASFGLL